MAQTAEVAIVHDYLTQRGGAERVVLALSRAFPGAPVFTSLYDPAGTFPEFGSLDVRTARLDRVPGLRRYHRLALPLLARSFSSTVVDAHVALCSSSGWAHGVASTGRKVVYCYTPARWLYQTDRYVGASNLAHPRGGAFKRVTLRVLRQHLESWDRAAAMSADRYIVPSSVSAAAVSRQYGIEAEVLPPPPALDASGPRRPVPGVEPGYWLSVSRLLSYKNIDVIIEAVRSRGGDRLVVVGEGPERARLRDLAGPETIFLRSLDDAELRWCYSNCKALLTASYEDFGLTPLEAAAFGSPTAAPRMGGFLDTIIDGRTGIFFERPDAGLLAQAMERVEETKWLEGTLVEHARSFSESEFAARLQEIVAAEASELE
ncbi:MAG: glycosyltransferase [Acidimicrobiales bacterium]